MKRYEAVIIYIIIIVVIIAMLKYTTKGCQRLFNEALYVGDRPMEQVMNVPDETKATIKEGYQKLKSTRLVIAGCLRDRADHIPQIKKMTEAMGRLASDYRILIVENDSSDGTRAELLKWAALNPKVEVLGCGINAESCKLNLPRTFQWDVNHTRMNKMRTIREMYVTRVKEAYSDWDYMLVWDYDLEGFLYPEGIAHAAMTLDMGFGDMQISGVASYGYYTTPLGQLYYDPFAYVPISRSTATNDFAVGNRNDMIYSRDPDKFAWTLKLSPGKYSPCYSAFAGAAIYRISSVINASYFTEKDEDPLECEHVTFSRRLGIMMVDGAMQFPVLENPRYM